MNPNPILAGDFQLIQAGVSAENVNRFVECFAEAWRQVGVDQGRLRTHYFGRAIVVLQAPISGAFDGIAAAGRDEDPFLMRANPRVIFDFPGRNASLNVLISEELAHAFLFACRDATHVPEITDPDQAEKRAYEIMKGWGCEMEEHERLIEWAKSHCKNGVWAPLPWK